MSHLLLLDIDLPGDLARFKLPASVDERLSTLLDKQDTTAGLTVQERSEAEGLVDLAETLTYLRLKAGRTA
jgi:hypothetical protein